MLTLCERIKLLNNCLLGDYRYFIFNSYKISLTKIQKCPKIKTKILLLLHRNN